MHTAYNRMHPQAERTHQTETRVTHQIHSMPQRMKTAPLHLKLKMNRHSLLPPSQLPVPPHDRRVSPSPQRTQLHALEITVSFPCTFPSASRASPWAGPLVLNVSHLHRPSLMLPRRRTRLSPVWKIPTVSIYQHCTRYTLMQWSTTYLLHNWSRSSSQSSCRTHGDHGQLHIGLAHEGRCPLDCNTAFIISPTVWQSVYAILIVG